MAKERFYPNNYKNAALLYEQYLEYQKTGNWIIFYTNFMQAGKTGDIECFLRTYFPDLIPDQVIHTTGLADLSLRSQTSSRLASCAKNYSVTELNNNPSLLNGAKIILQDESQYGVGLESRMEQLFVNIAQMEEKPLFIPYGATPFGVSNYNAKIVTGAPGKGYRGCFEFDQDGQIEDINTWYEDSSDGRSPYFKDISSEDEDVVLQKGFTAPFEEQLTRFDSLENGLAIIRCTDGHTLLEQALKTRSKKKSKPCLIVRAHVETGKIADKIKMAVDNCEYERVILIVVASMSAGNDIGEAAKQNLIFVVEPRETVVASELQGLVGRACGYHNNKTVKIICNPNPVYWYGQVQTNRIGWEQFDRMLETSGMNLATHVRIKNRDPKEYISCDSILININDIDKCYDILKSKELDADREFDCIKKVSNSYLDHLNQNKKGQFKITYKTDNLWANGQAEINYSNPAEFKKHIAKAVNNTLDFKVISHRTQNENSRNNVNRGFLFPKGNYFYYNIRGRFQQTARETTVMDNTIYSEYNV